jgi:hypothetical protein
MREKKKKARCSVAGCDGEAFCFGWCMAHHGRWRKHGDLRVDEPIRRLGKTPEERFWSYVQKSSKKRCWIWVGEKNRDGYGRIRVGEKKVSAHRFSYILAHGQIKKPFEIDHLCRRRDCVNPDHLEAVLHAVNVQRGESRKFIYKAIAAHQANAKKRTHCQKGHPVEQFYIGSDGRRRCDACRRLRYREYRRELEERNRQ